MVFSREKIGAAAQEIANHLQLVDHVKELKDGQKSLADGIAALGGRIRELELEMSKFKAEVRLEALKEAQSVVFAVQSGLNQRIENLAVQVAVMGAARSLMPVNEKSHRLTPGIEAISAEHETKNTQA
ncbi:hypothetical protein GALL_244440 [mine drainage metagenome]|uniref:Uncharacterized protein n=1 Tax=mine drainage metagenome TaxID=410659 RepID=A0A1J5RND9_9ZZZZ